LIKRCKNIKFSLLSQPVYHKIGLSLVFFHYHIYISDTYLAIRFMAKITFS
jgi:hypothetical protein